MNKIINKIVEKKKSVIKTIFADDKHQSIFLYS